MELVRWLEQKREEYRPKYSQPATLDTIFNHLVEDARRMTGPLVDDPKPSHE